MHVTLSSLFSSALIISVLCTFEPDNNFAATNIPVLRTELIVNTLRC